MCEISGNTIILLHDYPSCPCGRSTFTTGPRQQNTVQEYLGKTIVITAYLALIKCREQVLRHFILRIKRCERLHINDFAARPYNTHSFIW